MSMIGLWLSSAFILLFVGMVSSKDIIIGLGLFIWIVGGLILAVYIILTIIVEFIHNAINSFRFKKKDDEYKLYKQEVLDNPYCYMSFDKWKEERNKKKR